MAWDEPYEPDDEEDLPVAVRESDTISAAVGSNAYVERFELDECVEMFSDSLVARFPETFDRFYFAAVPPVLIDVLIGDKDEQDADADGKHVEFKRRWCATHDRRYVVLSEDDLGDVGRVRGLLAEPVAEDVEVESKPAPRRRGQVQRPKAAA